MTNAVLDLSGTMEVHARTNARGLPFLLHDGSVKGPSIGVALSECVGRPNSCDWSMNNFTNSAVAPSDIERPLLELGEVELFVDETKPSKPLTNYRVFKTNTEFNYEVTSGSQHFYLDIFLVDGSKDIRHGDMYYLHITSNSYSYSYLYKCTAVDNQSTFTILGDFQRRCTQKSSASQPIHFNNGNKFNFVVENINGSIILKAKQLIKDVTQWTKTVFNWVDPTPIAIQYIAVGSEKIMGKVTGRLGFPVLELTEETGSLTSPPLPPRLDRVCVSLVYYTDAEASISLLLQQDKTMSVVETVNTWQVGKGQRWRHQNIILDVPNSSNGETRVVVQATKTKEASLFIQRIAGCNAEDPEDVLVMPDQQRVTIQNEGIDVNHTRNYTILDSAECSNGGVKVGWLDGGARPLEHCVCPPGFTGKKCSQGCGPNRYGTDCGGVCSLTERGCRGMILCRPQLGCECAPGFKGHYCDTKCGIGEYGAGCRQRCGRCAGEACDIYTGVCHQGCKTEHYPPTCHHVYAYLSEPPKVVTKDFDTASVEVDFEHVEGRGTPMFYQLQYKISNASSWKKESPVKMPYRMVVTKSLSALSLNHPASLPLTGLKPGTRYLFRLVLIDVTGESYEGELVPTTSVLMPCIVPKKVDYLQYTSNSEYLRVSSVNEDGFVVEWKFPAGHDTWCPVIGYEVHVKMGWRWVGHSVGSDVTRKQFTGLLPGEKYALKVRPVTTDGLGDYAAPLVATTKDKEPDHVVDIRATKLSSRSIQVGWSPPMNPAGIIKRYSVTYQCLRLVACPEADCSASAGHMEVVYPTAVLEGLLPYALYNITVTAISGSPGPSSSLHVATALEGPGVAPSPATPSVTNRSNSSLVVQWAPPTSCLHVNGYLTGYRYELIPPDQKAPMVVASTTNVTAEFFNLVPHSEYTVRIFVENAAGWNVSHALEVGVKTRATTPEVVEELTVYKRGRRMLGLRWSKPRLSYGTLQSFTVSHRVAGDPRKPVSVTIKPSPCPAWPHLFCHTINSLKADTEYTIAVQARNSEVAEDGDEVTVLATTKEAAPSAPSYLRVLNKTDIAMTLEWGLPDMVNGQLRSFLVNVEETDSVNSTDCCQYFPLREVVVTSEGASYVLHVSDLRPASSYEASVSAKTVSLGPAVTLTAHTRPPAPVLTQAPKLIEAAVVGNPLKVQVEPVSGYQEQLISEYLLLLEGGASDNRPPISDEWLSNEIKKTLNGSFSLVAEFTQADVLLDGVVELHPGSPVVDGRFGSVGLPPLLPDTRYRLMWVLVGDYCGALNFGLVTGDPFVASKTQREAAMQGVQNLFAALKEKKDSATLGVGDPPADA